MNEKERIIELVRQNVITMDEALTLLEAATQNEENNANQENKTTINQSKKDNSSRDFEDFIGNVFEKSKQATEKVSQYIRDNGSNEPVDKYSKEYNDAKSEINDIQEDESSLVHSKLDEINKQLKLLSEERKPLDEKLVITKQRLRELEIFEELDDLTVEMKDQREELIKEKENLSKKLDNIIQKINQFELDKQTLLKDKVKESKPIINPELTDEITQKTGKFADEAVKGSVKLSKEIGKQAKGIIKNFDKKSISFEVPWIKTNTMEHTFEYSGENIENIDIVVNNGSVDIKEYDGNKILIESELRFYGQFDEISADVFEELSTISPEGDTLIFHVKSPKTSIDATVKVPRRIYNKIDLNLLNGDSLIKNISAKEIILKNKNGDFDIEDTKANILDIQNLNGDIVLKDLITEDLVIKNVSGDIQIVGSVQNVNAETVSGDIIITKKNTESSQFTLKTLSGDIKVSQPESMNIEIDAATASGEILHRLSNLDVEEVNDDNTKGKFQRIIGEQSNVITIRAKVSSGDILLKDRLS